MFKQTDKVCLYNKTLNAGVMKTIGYQDLMDFSGRIYLYNPKDKNTNLFNNQNHHVRITEGLNDLKSMGNIIIYLIKGRKYRKIFRKEF